MTNAEIERQAEQEAFDRVFHGMPPKTEREKMSPENLALELAKHQSGSPAYIILSHELSLRLAKEQSKATLSAGWLGAGATVIAVLLSAGIGYLAGTSKTKILECPVSQPSTTCNGTQNVAPPLPAKNEKQTGTHPAGNKP
jgi:hypothetical protein